MQRVTALSAALTLILGAGLMATMEPAQAATGVSIKTIPTKTVAYAGKVTIKPSVSVRGKIKVRSKRITVKSDSFLRKNATQASLRAGTYRVTTSVKYQRKGSRTWGRTRTSTKTQTLRIASKPAPAPAAPTAPAIEEGTATAPCGSQTHRKSDGSAWTCAFADDFSGSTLDRTKWSPQQTAIAGLHVGPECLVDDPDNVGVSGGVLRLTTRKEAKPFTCSSPYGSYRSDYTSAGVTTWGNFSQAYGRFEFRVKFPATTTSGVQSSLWLYPERQKYGVWPASGEIDIAEYYSLYPDRAIPYIHYNKENLTDPSVTNWGCKLDMSKFHTYVGEWTPTSIKISFDGTLCVTHRFDAAAPLTGSQPFDQPYAVIVTQVLGGSGSTNAFSSSTTPLPATTEVDYVRVWS